MIDSSFLLAQARHRTATNTKTLSRHRPGRTWDSVEPMGHASLVIFDGDDTLWSVELLYDAALDHAGRLIHGAGFSSDAWRVLQRTIDLENVEKLGMSRERFPRSSIEALDQLAASERRPVPDSLRAAVIAASEAVFLSRAPVIPGAVETLEALRPHFALALLTKGDQDVQRKRIADSGLGTWFDKISIVEEKDGESFHALASELGYAPAQCWSIGNSVASDINPALRLGMRAIWIDADVWLHERREGLLRSKDVVILDRLSDTPQLLLQRPARTA